MKLKQQTSPGVVQSLALMQVAPGGAVASSPPEVDPELDPELDELDPDPELDAPLELELRPPASSAGVPPVVDDPPHAAANAATQLPTKRTLSILMDDLLETAPAVMLALTLYPKVAARDCSLRVLRRVRAQLHHVIGYKNVHASRGYKNVHASCR
jgi:hypothetical protein